MTMSEQNLKKVTAVYCMYIQTKPAGLKVFSFNTLPTTIERDTLNYLASYVAKKTI